MEGFRVFIPQTETPETVTINIYKPTPAELDMIKHLAENGVLTALEQLVQTSVEAPGVESLEEDDIIECKEFIQNYLTDSHGHLGDELLLRMFKTCSSRKSEPGAYAKFKSSLLTTSDADKQKIYEAWIKQLAE